MCYNCSADPDEDYPTEAVALAKSPTATQKQLRELVEKFSHTPEAYSTPSYDPTVRAAVAANPNVDAALLKQLTQDEDWQVVSAAISNRGTPDETIAQLFVTGVSTAITVADKRFPPSYFVSLLHNNPSYGRRRWVRSRAFENATPSDLERFSYSENDEVRESVAFSQRATAEQLRRLATDATIRVRSAVARNARTPTDVVEALTNDSSPKVRKEAGENTGVSVMTVLATEVERFRVLQTPKAGKAVISREAEVREWVRTAYPELAAFEPNVSLTALMEFVSADPRGFAI